MKIPGVSTIKALYYANRPCKMANYKNNVVIKKELDGYFDQVIGDMYGKINDYAVKAGLKLHLAQEGDTLFISSGCNSSYIKKNEIKNVSDIYNKIVANIDETMAKILASGQ